MEGDLLGADPLHKNHRLVGGTEMREHSSLQQPGEARGNALPLAATYTAAAGCTFRARAPKDTCPTTIEYATYSELSPA